jgi:hypothetical protein
MDIEALVRAPGTPIALAAFRLSASDPDLLARLKLMSQDMPPQRDPEEWGIRPVWLFKGVRIDPVAGRYFYSFAPDVGPPESREWEMSPWDPEGSPDFGKVLDGTVHALKVKASEAWLIIADRFQRALLDGTIVVAGRSGSPTAEVTAVPKDAWGLFQVLNWGTGYAETDHGERLYALQVMAPERGAEEAEKPSRSGWMVRQAKEIIERLYPDGGDKILTDKELTEVVRSHLHSLDKNLKAPSKRTIRRASGRDA